MSGFAATERTCPGSQPLSPLRIASAQPVQAMRFLGRGDERVALDGLLSGAREGRSGALVIRGEPGIGKSAVLDYAVRSAAGFQVAQACGVEAERELSFAGLQLLCGPAADRIRDLPAPQADALEVALGLRRGEPPDRFMVGLAVLSLLSALAEERPVLWVIDDAQWLDQASTQVLGFVARRHQVGQVFASPHAEDERDWVDLQGGVLAFAHLTAKNRLSPFRVPAVSFGRYSRPRCSSSLFASTCSPVTGIQL